MSDPLSSQGSSVSFAGAALGQLLNVQWNGGSATLTDVTTGAIQRGSGAGLYAIKEYVCTSAEAGSCTVEFYGSGPPCDVGDVGVLSASIAGATFTGQACCTGYSVQASVGEFVRATATFTLIGG